MPGGFFAGRQRHWLIQGPVLGLLFMVFQSNHSLNLFKPSLWFPHSKRLLSHWNTCFDWHCFGLCAWILLIFWPLFLQARVQDISLIKSFLLMGQVFRIRILMDGCSTFGQTGSYAAIRREKWMSLYRSSWRVILSGFARTLDPG